MSPRERDLRARIDTLAGFSSRVLRAVVAGVLVLSFGGPLALLMGADSSVWEAAQALRVVLFAAGFTVAGIAILTVIAWYLRILAGRLAHRYRA